MCEQRAFLFKYFCCYYLFLFIFILEIFHDLGLDDLFFKIFIS